MPFDTLVGDATNRIDVNIKDVRRIWNQEVVYVNQATVPCKFNAKFTVEKGFCKISHVMAFGVSMCSDKLQKEDQEL